MATSEIVTAEEYRSSTNVGLRTKLYFTWNVDYTNEKITITDCYMSGLKYTNVAGAEGSIIPTPTSGTGNFLWHVYCYQTGTYPPTSEIASGWYTYNSKIDTTVHYFYKQSNTTNKLSFDIPFDNITWNGSTFSFRIAAKLKPSWDTSVWFENGSRPDKSITVNCPSYTVSYNANGGSGAPSAQTKYYRQNLTLSSTKPTKANSTFLGWATSSTATTATYLPGGTYSNNSGTTLYAVWKTNITTYNTSYNLNGGNFPSGETAPPTTYEVTGTRYKIPRPIKTGFTFYLWYFSNLSTSSQFWLGADPWVITNATTKTISYNEASNMWVYHLGDAGKTVSAVASWTPIEYSIAYDFDGGAFTYIRSGNSSVYNLLSDEGTVGTNYCPTYLYNPLGTIKYDLSNYSAHANHTHNDYFHLDSPSKLGFTFKGWYITGMDNTAHNFWYDGQPNTTNSTFFDTSLVANINAPARHLRASAGTVTYRALWDPIVYNINYVLNGGVQAHENGWIDDNPSNTYARQYNPLFVYYDNSLYDPVNAQRHNVFTVDTPTREGYTFNGWTITGIDNPASSTSDYSLAYMWDNGKKAITTTTYTTPSNFIALEFRKLRKTAGTVTFTANWIKNNTIQFNANGGAGGTSSITVCLGETMPSINIPSREGHNFLGYYLPNTIWNSDSSMETSASNYNGVGEAEYTFTYNDIILDIGNPLITIYDNNANNEIVELGTPTYHIYNDRKSIDFYYDFSTSGYPRNNSFSFEITFNYLTYGTSPGTTQYYNSTGNPTISTYDKDHDVTLYANWQFRGNYIYKNSTDKWVKVVPFVYDGSTWRETQPFVYTSNGWKSLIN